MLRFHPLPLQRFDITKPCTLKSPLTKLTEMGDRIQAKTGEALLTVISRFMLSRERDGKGEGKGEGEGVGTVQMIHLHRSYMLSIGVLCADIIKKSYAYSARSEHPADSSGKSMRRTFFIIRTNYLFQKALVCRDIPIEYAERSATS